MLSKLLKYDFKATFKYFIPMSIFILAYSLLSTLLFSISDPSTYTGSTLKSMFIILCIAAFVIFIIGYSIVTQGIIVVNFFKSMVTDTGYLTHTLPVKKSTLIASKVINGMVVLLMSYIVVILCLVAFLDVPTNVGLYGNELARGLSQIKEIFGAGLITATCISVVFMILASILQALSIFFFSIAVGQLMNRHKVIGSFVAYFVIIFLMQIVSTIISFLSNGALSFGTVMISNSTADTWLPYLFGITGLVELIISSVFLFFTYYIFDKKLNLD